ncbi:MAG: 4-hydroxybenzoate octaprenyltransferase [Rickettsia sp.]|nr:4-hydroxybenzoate octaprenyltransferase [Rickettsia sp.]
MNMKNYLIEITNLIRLKNLIGFILVFYPPLFSIMIYSIIFNERPTLEFLKILFIFFAGSFFARSAGCIINDICDQKIDAFVERTKNRPLAKKSLLNRDAIIILIIFLIVSLNILLTLNYLAIKIAICSFVMMMIYPLTKKIFKIPQIFLGFTINTGALIAHAALANQLDFYPFIIYIGCNFWTLGYDTLYAFSDLKDDKKIKINSSAIFLEKKNFKLIISLFYFLFLLLFYFIIIKMIYLYLNVTNKLAITFFCFAILSGIFIYIIFKLKNFDYKKANQGVLLFKQNGYLGICLTMILIFLKILQI